MCCTNNKFDDYYFTVYSLNDEYICGFDNIDMLSNLFNIEFKELLRKLRNRNKFTLNGKLVKVYVYKKEKNIESRGKRKWERKN